MRVVDGALFSIPGIPPKAQTENKASSTKALSTSASLNLTPSIPTIKLSPEVSKSLIEGGIFDHDAKTTVWLPPNKAANAMGGPIGSIANLNLKGLQQLHPYKVSGEEDVLVPALRSMFEQVAPVLESPGLEPIADAVAFCVDAPEICKALLHLSSKTRTEKVLLFGTNLFRVLAIGNSAAHLPFDDALDGIITLFKCGEEVYVAGQQKPAGVAERDVKKRQETADNQKAKPTR